MSPSPQNLAKTYYPGRAYTELTVRDIDETLNTHWWLLADWEVADLRQLRDDLEQLGLVS